MRILVTGGAGFIGSNFVLHLLKKYGKRHVLVNLDSLTYAGNLANLDGVKKSKNHVFVKGDITHHRTVDSLFDAWAFDAVVHFAAESHVDRSILDPQVFLKTNVLGTETLLSVAKKHWKTKTGWKKGVRFLQVSTDEVYGSLGKKGLFKETTPLNPHSPYSASKASADLLVRAWFDTFGLPVNITRCSNNYGPFQFPEKLIPLLIRNALTHQPIPVYGDGRNVRDWLHVQDHCEAIDVVLHQAPPGEIFNIGGNNEEENINVVRRVLGILQNRTKDKAINEGLITFVPDRLGHDRRYAMDASKIRKELGWTPRVDFKTGLDQTVDWYLKNRVWMENVVTGAYRKYYNRNYAQRPG